ncbi:MAG: dTMP kinase [Gammaproteobacteria bacterium]|nr:MAG: dTMP kinase [Gammaproteobacteria bacterium]
MHTENKGQFVTLEGIEGVGKSSHLPAIRRYFESRGHRVVTTREPGGTPLGERLRQLLLQDKSLQICDDTELMLMFAARAEHLSQVIRPELENGSVVISDRFTDSTFAYQGGGRGLPQDRIAELEHWVQGGLRPDLTLLFDAPVEIALQRAARRSNKDRIEDQELSFFEDVRNCFLRRCQMEPERFVRIDSSRSYDEVEAAVLSALKRRYE